MGIISRREARKEALKAGFRSNFEYEFSKKLKALKKKVSYETDKLLYTQPEVKRVYTPDWTIKKDVYIETKGIFSSVDRKKILLVLKSNPEITLYLLFQNSKLTLSKKSNTTYAEWCDKNNIKWADIKDINRWRKWFL